MSGPGSDNNVAQKAAEMTIPSQYDNKDFGKPAKIVTRKVSIKGPDGKLYGSRTIATKEGEKMKFSDFLLAEDEDLSLLPDMVISQIRSNIKKGAKDLAQNWKDAIELVHKAYQVANVRRPTPEQKMGWKQYEDLLRDGVRELSKSRGLNGQWRTSTVMMREDSDWQPKYAPSDENIGKHRFFAEIPGQAAFEIDAPDLDEAIDQIGNKLQRHGAKMRIEQRNKEGAIITVWVQGIKRERIIIKDLS